MNKIKWAVVGLGVLGSSGAFAAGETGVEELQSDVSVTASSSSASPTQVESGDAAVVGDSTPAVSSVSSVSSAATDAVVAVPVAAAPATSSWGWSWFSTPAAAPQLDLNKTADVPTITAITVGTTEPVSNEISVGTTAPATTEINVGTTTQTANAATAVTVSSAASAPMSVTTILSGEVVASAGDTAALASSSAAPSNSAPVANSEIAAATPVVTAPAKSWWPWSSSTPAVVSQPELVKTDAGMTGEVESTVSQIRQDVAQVAGPAVQAAEVAIATTLTNVATTIANSESASAAETTPATATATLATADAAAPTAPAALADVPVLEKKVTVNDYRLGKFRAMLPLPTYLGGIPSDVIAGQNTTLSFDSNADKLEDAVLEQGDFIGSDEDKLAPVVTDKAAVSTAAASLDARSQLEIDPTAIGTEGSGEAKDLVSAAPIAVGEKSASDLATMGETPVVATDLAAEPTGIAVNDLVAANEGLLASVPVVAEEDIAPETNENPAQETPAFASLEEFQMKFFNGGNGGDVSVIRSLIKSGSVNEWEYLFRPMDPRFGTKPGHTPMLVAAANGWDALVAAILDNPEYRANAEGSEYRLRTTALHEAAAGLHLSTIQLLIAKGKELGFVSYRSTHLVGEFNSLNTLPIAAAFRQNLTKKEKRNYKAVVQYLIDQMGDSVAEKRQNGLRLQKHLYVTLSDFAAYGQTEAQKILFEFLVSVGAPVSEASGTKHKKR